MVTKISNELEKGNITCNVFLDFAKAFDTVDHDILLGKLQHYGIRGRSNQWFESYLKNRYQSVKIRGQMSSKELITCGVPQGSILGPILFLLYINDIKNSSKMLQFFLFADDTSTLLTGKDIHEIESNCNKELGKVSN